MSEESATCVIKVYKVAAGSSKALICVCQSTFDYIPLDHNFDTCLYKNLRWAGLRYFTKFVLCAGRYEVCKGMLILILFQPLYLRMIVIFYFSAL
jgi:hypothetical protein